MQENQPDHSSAQCFTPDEIEAARKLFAREWRFVSAAGSPAAVPASDGIEIAFAGRSNVGKSSLINALTGQRALARTSRTPGRTQELIFFSGGGLLRLVDLPGYGYAAAPKTTVRAWTGLMQAYLEGRPNLARVYLLIDARRGLMPADAPMLGTLDEAAVGYQTVLTKTDQIPQHQVAAAIAAVTTAIERRPAAFPGVLATSARTGAGIPELRAAVARVAAERPSFSYSPRAESGPG